MKTSERERHITEWDLNHALHLLLKQQMQYMLVFQDSDLHSYADRHLIPMTKATSKKPTIRRATALTHRQRHISVDPQQFRPDAILVDAHGQPIVMETKIGNLRAEAECEAVVLQTLVYSDLILTPRWKPPTRCTNEPPSTTYDLLEDLHEAHWFLKVVGEGAYRPIEQRHRKHFCLQRPLDPKAFCTTPSVIFLFEDVDEKRLLNACRRVRELPFDRYQAYAEQALRKNVAFRKHIPDLRANWGRLQQTPFQLMRIAPSSFTSIVLDEFRELT